MTFEIDAKRGVAKSYGPRVTDGKFGAYHATDGIVHKAMWDFAYNGLPAAGTNKLQFSIPANSTIVSAKLFVDSAFTSTSGLTDLVVGLYKSDGTVISADGLVTAVNATEATIAVADSVITGTGALVGKTIGAVAGELVVAPSTADLLTGTGRVVVEFTLNS
jgi:hypothetical protein